MTSGGAVIGAPPGMRGYQGTGIEPIIGQSVRIHPGAVIERGRERATRIGDLCTILPNAVIGHDAIIGENVDIGPGAVICGHAEVGKGVRIGANATILPYVKVGAGARVGAGAVVDRDVPRWMVVAGPRAERVRK